MTWLLALLVTAPPAPWEVRYVHLNDQTPEWTAAGYVPAWTLTWADAARPELTWTDDEAGNCRGLLLLGRPLTIPDPAPAEASVTLDYQTRCAMDEPRARSGQLSVFVCTSEAWSKLATEPARAAIVDLAREPGMLAFSAVKGQGADVTEWTTSGPVDLGARLRAAAGQTVWCGVVWGCAHYGTPESGGLRNLEVRWMSAADVARRFWDALDLTRPELAAVRDAVARQDEPAATRALARHFRERTRPVVANPVQPADDRGVAAADLVLQHTYRLAGTPSYTFPGPIVWNADPFNYEQWAIALNRHSEWTRLAAAWLKTKDDRYAREWQAQANDWVATMPVHIGRGWVQGPYNEAGKSPLSLDAGIRMGQTWFPTFEVFRQAAVITDETIVTVLRSLHQHAVYLLRPENYKRGSNWGAMESNGLYHLGVLLPEFRDAALWRQTALERTLAELDGQVYPDGAQHELAPGYHGVSLGNFLGVLRLARANEQAVPPQFEAGLERMFDYYLRIAKPNLRMPQLNDSGEGGIQGHFREAVTLFPNRPDFRWALTSRAEGTPPGFGSLAMPWAGWVIFRTGWEPEARWSLFSAGPFGTGHQHEDKLSLILHAFGRDLVTEAGIYAYDDSPWRRYVLSTRAHSTVRVDGQDQACRASRDEYRATQPDLHGFRSDEAFDYARDTHTAGYGNPPQKSVLHRRRVLFVKPDWWLVVDDLTATDEADHTAETQFLLNQAAATVGAAGLTTGDPLADGARVAVAPLHSGARVRVVQGQREPEVLGFIAEGFEQLRPAPAMLETTTFRGRALRAYAILPFRGEAAPLAVERPGEGRAVVTVDGRRHEVEVTPTRLVVVSPAGRFEQAEPPLSPEG